MNNLYNKINKRKKLLYLFVTVILFNLIISLIFSYLRNKFQVFSKNENLSFDSIFEEFTLVVILAPLLETLIFQKLFIELTLKFTNKYIVAFSYYLAIVIPAIFFALSHGNNTFYIVNTFLGGLSLNFLYLFAKENYFYPFFITALAHSLYNFLIFNLRHV